MKRERKIEGEREEINYLSLCGPYGALQLPVVKMDLRPEKCALQSTAAPLQTKPFFFFFLILRTVKRSRRPSKEGTLGEASASHDMDHNQLTSNLLPNTTNVQMHVAFPLK